MESLFVLMSELTVLGGGKDETRQTIILTGPYRMDAVKCCGLGSAQAETQVQRDYG